MAFPVDGSNHRDAVQVEKNFGKHISKLEVIYGEKIIKIIHKGGTKFKTDVCIIFKSGKIKNVSIKKKKTVTQGSFDYVNTTNFSEKSFTKTKKIIKNYIIKREVCPELVFQVGICENPSCIDSCNPNHYCATDTCPHRLVSFEYEAEYTYIEVYGGTVYKIRIVL